MAFSLGSALGSLGGLISPIAGLASTIGGAIGAVRGAFGAPARATQPVSVVKAQKLAGFSTSSAPSGVTRLQAPAQARGGLPLVPGGRALTLMGRGSRLSELLQAARTFTGRAVTAQAIRAAALTCGIALAAEIFGLNESEVCEVVIAKKRRRSRGISAADMRRTRSTLRKVCTIQRQVKEVTGRRRVC